MMKQKNNFAQISRTLLMNGILVIGCLLTAQAATLTVTKTADTNDGVCNADCSLREAITGAAANDSIVFASPLFDSAQVITLLDVAGFRDLVINKNLTITGKGANLLTIQRTAGSFRIFNVNGSGVQVSLNKITISGGNALTFNGGGINANSGVSLTISNSHITGNIAGAGGGIYVTADSGLLLFNCTVSANTANGNTASGGAIHSEGTLGIFNSTVSGNVKTGSQNNAGGILANGTTLITNSTVTDNETVGAMSAGGVSGTAAATIRNSIVAGNRNNSNVPDVFGAITSAGFNLIGNAGSSATFTQPGDRAGTSAAVINPLLRGLFNNGGGTPTHGLTVNSPALDQGKNVDGGFDQRGQTRPFDLASVPNAAGGDGSDTGAVEEQILPASQPPTANSDSYTTDEDVPLIVAAPGVLANDSDPDGDPLTAVLVTTPTRGGINFRADGSFSYFMIANFNGTDSFTYKVNDGANDSNIVTVFITINAVNDVPAAVNDFYDVRPNNTLSVPASGVLQNDSDVESPLTAILVSNVSNGTLSLASNGGIIYTPNANFTGTDSFTYKANDGILDSNIATVTIFVNNPVQWTVTSIADTTVGACDADCTLREAIAAAAPGDEIIFSTLFNTPQTITLTNAAGFKSLVINKSLKISGKGANLLTVRRIFPGINVDAANAFRIFNVTGSGIRVTLSGMTISGGHPQYFEGAGIYNNGGSNLTVSGCYITDNFTFGLGGGIFNTADSTLTVIGSTIANNSAGSHTIGTGSGGSPNGGSGIDSRGTLNIINSTVSGNTKFDSAQVSSFNGGVYAKGTTLISGSTITRNNTIGANSASNLYNGGAAVTVRNSIIADATNPAEDVAGSAFISQGYNLIGNVGAGIGFGAVGDQVGAGSFAKKSVSTAVLSPRLEPLGFYGGIIPVHPLKPDSPAIDKGNSFGLTTDQRGLLRPVDTLLIANLADGADIGAYEIQFSPTAASVSISGRILTPDGRGLSSARVILTDGSGNSRTAITSSFGYYRFGEVSAGQTYIISVVSKRFQFTTQVITVNEDVTELNFIGN